MNVKTLLADPDSIEIEKFVSRDDSILIVVHSTGKAADCPQCGTSSNSLKCRYLRRIADLPWHGTTVRLELRTRKFRCRNAFCRQKVFCERLPKIVRSYGRKTVRLVTALKALAFALGGRGGSRIAAQLNLPVGKDSLLCAVGQNGVTNAAREKQSVKFSV